MPARRKLPPLPALCGFESAARHLSFKAAAEELSVTHSAISHQVKSLETFVGTSLFERTHQGLKLTAKGQEYFAEVIKILDRLDRSTENVMDRAAAGPLTICATPAFLSRWLIPRLDYFRRNFPEIDLVFRTYTSPRPFPGGDVDIYIQYGDAQEDGCTVTPFLYSTSIPVASPIYLAELPPLNSPRDLGRASLLRDLVGDRWSDWFAVANCPLPAQFGGPVYEHCDLTLTAAEEGQGVALAYEVLARPGLERGNLIRLFDLETSPLVTYSLSCPSDWHHFPRIAAFRQWVISQVKRCDRRVTAA